MNVIIYHSILFSGIRGGRTIYWTGSKWTLNVCKYAKNNFFWQCVSCTIEIHFEVLKEFLYEIHKVVELTENWNYKYSFCFFHASCLQSNTRLLSFLYPIWTPKMEIKRNWLKLLEFNKTRCEWTFCRHKILITKCFLFLFVT